MTNKFKKENAESLLAVQQNFKIENNKFYRLKDNVWQEYNGWKATTQGHRQVSCIVNEKRVIFYLHRVVWALCKNEWPADYIDHIDRNPTNNSIKNLRTASISENNQNRRKSDKKTSSSLIGVSKHIRREKWQATIKVNGTCKHLGYYDTESEAGQAYLLAKSLLHPSVPKNFYAEARQCIKNVLESASVMKS